MVESKERKIESFDKIRTRAEKRKGGAAEVEALFPGGIKKPAQLKKLGDDFYLAAMTKAVFKAGFVWKVIDNKWPNFEKAFWNFNVRRCCAISADDIDALTKNADIVRNHKKIQSVQHNAAMFAELAEEYGSFARMLAEWPGEDFVSLVSLLKKRGDRLGLQSCQYFCRAVGKDGYVLSNDVIAALIGAGVIDKAPTSKNALANVQMAFNQWREETGLGLAQMSRILALSIDA